MDEFSPGPNASSQGTSPLRIGLLVDSLTASIHVYDFTQWAQSHPNIAVTHLFLQGGPATEPGSKLFGVLTRLIHSAKGDKLYFALSEMALHIIEFFERF